VCLFIGDARTNDHQLAAIRVRHLRAYIEHSGIDTDDALRFCLEKNDLIRLIQSVKRRHNERPTAEPSRRLVRTDLSDERVSKRVTRLQQRVLDAFVVLLLLRSGAVGRRASIEFDT
jgi:hypothetical protein